MNACLLEAEMVQSMAEGAKDEEHEEVNPFNTHNVCLQEAEMVQSMAEGAKDEEQDDVNYPLPLHCVH